MGDVASSLREVEAVVRLVDASVGYSRTPAGAARLHVILTRQPTDAEHAQILTVLADLPEEARYGRASEGVYGTLWAEVDR